MKSTSLKMCNFTGLNNDKNCEQNFGIYFDDIPFSHSLALVLSFAIFGLTFNIIILKIYHSIKCPLTVYIKALSVLDIVFLLNMIFLFIAKRFFEDIKPALRSFIIVFETFWYLEKLIFRAKYLRRRFSSQQE